MTDGRDARDVYELRLVDAPRRNRALRWAAVAMSNLVSEGHGMRNPGGRRAVVVERATGRCCAEFMESIDADATGDVALVLAGYETMSADEFIATWIDGADSRA